MWWLSRFSLRTKKSRTNFKFKIRVLNYFEKSEKNSAVAWGYFRKTPVIPASTTSGIGDTLQIHHIAIYYVNRSNFDFKPLLLFRYIKLYPTNKN